MQAEQLELFNPNRLPQAPYCTRGKGEAVVIRRLQSALRNPLIQINLPVLTWWLVFDIDHPQAAVAWQDAGLPPPNWVAVNPSNGHAHMVYGLSIPVKTADPEHIKALRYFAAVYDAMAVALKADLNYSGLLTKNPTHEKWRTEWVYNALYELSELAEYVASPTYKNALRAILGALGAIALFSISCACGHTLLFASIGPAPLLLGVRLFMPKRKAAMSLRALFLSTKLGQSVRAWPSGYGRVMLMLRLSLLPASQAKGKATAAKYKQAKAAKVVKLTD
jgi:hypothetical protein